MSNIRDKFRKRFFGQMGYASGEEAETMGDPIIQTPSDQLENQQTGNAPARYHKLYKLGQRPPKRQR